MCLPGLGTAPAQPTIAAPPAPPMEGPTAPVLGAEGTDASLVKAARRGRSSLRIDLASGPLADGTGLNIPSS